MGSFFALAMLSPGRQLAFRRAIVAHLVVLGAGAIGLLHYGHVVEPTLLGHVLLVSGIVEGAVMVGWRLTQVPKSQALEFLLVSPLRPWRVFLAEATTGLARLALVTLSGLPILTLLVITGRLAWADLGPLLVMPLTWGALTGMGLTVWAYEPLRVRRWGERFVMVMIVLYLGVGVLAGEHLRQWLAWLPFHLSDTLLNLFVAFHMYNPFAILQLWLDPATNPALFWEEMLGLELAALAIIGVLVVRGASRFKEHFHDRHYRPMLDLRRSEPDRVGNHPLSWWAVRRVMEYSGRINLWLAGGFGILYALYIVAGANWPSWLGRLVFLLIDIAGGGIPLVATGLVLLSAVPAAFQYGLWDSNAQDRCRRLELLLLTELEARDYWHAAASAAWRRGRGYLSVAVLLWIAGALAGRLSVLQVAAAIGSSTILWGFYFTVGFRAFSRGMQANGLGSLLTIGLPLLVYVLHSAGWAQIGALLPPGGVFYAATAAPTIWWVLGALLAGLATLLMGRLALKHCDGELRHWYDLNHGQKSVE